MLYSKCDAIVIFSLTGSNYCSNLVSLFMPSSASCWAVYEFIEQFTNFFFFGRVTANASKSHMCMCVCTCVCTTQLVYLLVYVQYVCVYLLLLQELCNKQFFYFETSALTGENVEEV